MPHNSPISAVCHCPVVDHTIVLSRDRLVMDYIVLREGDATCSNLHECLSKYGNIKHIEACLLHNAHVHLQTNGGPNL